jgi:SAM-dependent methyltransferase
MIGALERIPLHMGGSNPLTAQSQALRNLRTVLKPGGWLCLITDNRFSFRTLLGRRDAHTGLRFISVLPRWAGNLYSRLRRRQPYVEWTHSHTELKDLLLEAGFAEVQVLFPVPDYRKARFWLDYQDKAVSQFLLNNLRAFPAFNPVHYSIGRLGLALGIERLISPSLCGVGIAQ